ncbi:MAG: DUF4411 family protein [Victivallales bacterium]|nr:DUF4411 family protein [Victivallales bacterium]
MTYLLDANIFIQAHRFYYPKDVFPAFWDWLEEENYNGNICSTLPVYNEIKEGDELYEWVQALDRDKWFLSVDDAKTQGNITSVADWAMNHTQFKQNAKDDFLRKADSLIIAKAMSARYTLVTEEKSSPNSKAKIFIPDVCNVFNVNYCSTIDLLRILRAKF